MCGCTKRQSEIKQLRKKRERRDKVLHNLGTYVLQGTVQILSIDFLYNTVLYSEVKDDETPVSSDRCV